MILFIFLAACAFIINGDYSLGTLVMVVVLVWFLSPFIKN